MKICTAQIRPISGDIARNIGKHKAVIGQAASLGADLIFFPELSITGYEPTLAEKLATTPDDPRFDDFQKISDTNRITICIGMPTRDKAGIRISMIIFQPHTSWTTYSKQLLHSDELPYFIAGDTQAFVSMGNKKVAPAICYESLQPQHAAYAIGAGANVYLASVAKSASGVEKAFAYFPGLAKQYGIPVLMSNATGFCDNFESAGRSAAWDSRGELLASLDDRSEGILILDTETNTVTTELIGAGVNQ